MGNEGWRMEELVTGETTANAKRGRSDPVAAGATTKSTPPYSPFSILHSLIPLLGLVTKFADSYHAAFNSS